MNEEMVKRWKATDLKNHAETCEDKKCIKSKHKIWEDWIEKLMKKAQEYGYTSISHLYGV